MNPRTPLPTMGWRTAGSHWVGTAMCRRRKHFRKRTKRRERRSPSDESLAAAHTSLAFVRFNYDWDWSGAERGFQRAIELDPDYPNAHHWYADYLSAIGRHEQAIAESERARRLDPLSPIINAWLGWRHHFARQYDAAVEQYRGR